MQMYFDLEKTCLKIDDLIDFWHIMWNIITKFSTFLKKATYVYLFKKNFKIILTLQCFYKFYYHTWTDFI